MTSIWKFLHDHANKAFLVAVLTAAIAVLNGSTTWEHAALDLVLLALPGLRKTGAAGQIRTTSAWGLVLIAPLMGCSFLTPGLDTRTATEQKTRTVWDNNDTLWLDQSTTHNQRTAAAEGDNVKIEFYPDGTPKSIEGATHALSQCSEPKDVAGAYAHLADRNAEVAGKLTDMMTTIVPQLLPLFARGQSPSPGMSDQVKAALAGIDPGAVEAALAGQEIDPAVVKFILDTIQAQRPAAKK